MIITWRRKWQPTPVFLCGEFHGQRSLEDCSPWGHKELDPTEQLSTHAHSLQIMLCSYVLVAQSRPTLCDPMDCSPPGSSVYGILQARILEWAAISFSRRSSQPTD